MCHALESLADFQLTGYVERTQAKFHKLKREVIEDVRNVFPHGEILVRVHPSASYGVWLSGVVILA